MDKLKFAQETPLHMEVLIKDPEAFLDDYLKHSSSEFGLVIFESYEFLHHKDCFGWKIGDSTEETITTLLTNLASEHGAVVCHTRAISPEYFVICPGAENTKNLANSALKKMADQAIKVANEDYLKRYPAPEGDISLTASVLLLPNPTGVHPVSALIKKVYSLHGISGHIRHGKVTVLDLTIQ